MVETQLQGADLTKKEPQGSAMSAQQPMMQQAAQPKPLSTIDKLKMMLVRIGDEMRHNRDDNLQKLKAQLTSSFVLKEKTNRFTVTETLITCIHCQPHKVNLYSALLALIAIEDFDFAADLIRQIIESLHQVFVLDANPFASKNVLRLLGSLVQMKLISSEAFCKFLLQLVEEFEKMNAVQEGQPSGCSSHSVDLMLEVILASLPATATILSREQSIDFGTVLESLKTMLKEREKTRQHLLPLESSDGAVGSDLLTRTWEAFTGNVSKVFCVDEVLISASRKLFVEILEQVAQLDRQIESLPQVYLAEFNSAPYCYTLQTASQVGFQRERLRRYRSPFVLSGMTTGINDKYQAILAVDIAMALVQTFEDSHEMLASNLLNMYIAEELKEHLPKVVFCAILSLVVHSEKPFQEQSVFYTMLTNSLIEQAKSIETMKKLKSQFEDHFVRFVFSNVHLFKRPSQRRVCNFLALLLSQTAGRDLGQTEPLLLKITKDNLTPVQASFLRMVFSQLCKLCFVKKVWDQLDPTFHCYLPEQPGNQGNASQANPSAAPSADDPDMQLITDAMLAKQTSEQLLEVVTNGAVFVRAVLTRTKKSLEHLKTSVDRYKRVFDELLSGPEGESQIIEQVVSVFRGNSSEEENDKVEKVMAKLAQIDCISNRAIIEWACDSIAKCKENASQEEIELEFNLIIQALKREAVQKWITVTLYQQKPPSITSGDPEGIDRMDDPEGGNSGEEHKQRGGDFNMMDDADGNKGDASGRRGSNRLPQSFNERRRLSLAEYENQFAQRLAKELEVFSFAIAKLESILQKSSHIQPFIMHVVRSVETAFITSAEVQQCLAQTINLADQQLCSLVRLL